MTTPRATGAPTKRYAETPSIAVRSGFELGQDASMDDKQNADMNGDLDVDVAELSLGQRLTALTGQEEAAPSASSSDDEHGKHFSERKPNHTAREAVPASSLTRTLIQALHSSDANLLETCLAHSNTTLIQSTVRKLPPQLAVPLITACVERLGRGKGVGRGKGGGGGAGAQRGTGLIRWIRAVLIIHGGHLLTMPDLVARLSGLHATLSTRLALQESLLSLSGRLDLVISQIEMRSSSAPAPLPLPGKRNRKGKKKKAAKQARALLYVEGQSTDDEDEEASKEVEVESGDDAGSVEDVELGGDEEEDGSEPDTSDDDEDEDEEDEEDEDYDEDEDESEGGGSKMNGFIDDEAEEFSGDEDEDESD